MEYVYAALLLHKLKKEITEDSVKSVIQSTGVTPNEVQVKALVAALSDVNIEEVLKSAPVAAASVSTSQPDTTTTSVPKEEEKKEEKKEEEALEGLSALFG
jgi:large subunit ribosomal protein L12